MNEELDLEEELKKLDAESLLLSALISAESLCSTTIREKTNSQQDSIGFEHAKYNIADTIFKNLGMYAEQGYIDINEVFDIESEYWKEKVEYCETTSNVVNEKTIQLSGRYYFNGMSYMMKSSFLEAKEPVWHKIVKYAVAYRNTDMLGVLKHIAPYINLYSECNDDYKIDTVKVLYEYGYYDILLQILGNKNPKTLRFIDSTQKMIDETDNDEKKETLNKELEQIKYRTIPLTEQKFIENHEQVIHLDKIYSRLHLLRKIKENDMEFLSSIIANTMNSRTCNFCEIIKKAIEKKMFDRDIVESIAEDYVIANRFDIIEIFIDENVYDFKDMFCNYREDNKGQLVTVIVALICSKQYKTALKLYDTDKYFNKDNNIIIGNLLFSQQYEYLLQLLKSPNFVDYDGQMITSIQNNILANIDDDSDKDKLSKNKDTLAEITSILNIKRQELEKKEASIKSKSLNN